MIEVGMASCVVDPDARRLPEGDGGFKPYGLRIGGGKPTVAGEVILG
jgi:hypothetical protein